MVLKSLKNYLRIKKSKFNNTSRGCIDDVNPNIITGWVFCKDKKLAEVRLIADGELVSNAPIDQDRPDVVKAYQISGKYGFSMKMPSNMEGKLYSQTPRLLALSVDGELQLDLGKFKNNKSKLSKIKNILNSKISGSQGSFDGISEDGHLFGWALNNSTPNPIDIWLNCDGEILQKVKCDLWRDGLNIIGIKPRKCGFNLSIEKINKKYYGKEVWFSFDSEGFFPLSQNQRVLIPQENDSIALVNTTSTNLVSSNDDEDYINMIKNSSEDLKDHWESLEDFRFYLQSLDNELQRHNQILSKRELYNKSKILNFKSIKNLMQKFLRKKLF